MKKKNKKTSKCLIAEALYLDLKDLKTELIRLGEKERVLLPS